MQLQDKAREVVRRLAASYPAECELDFGSPWELLVATVLSAQSTDARVNRVMPSLLERWPGPEELAAAEGEELEEVIRPTGMYRNKARSLKAMAERVVELHQGRVPEDLGALTDLAGVGPKTAKVVLGVAMGIPAGIAVDTHAARVSRRLGLSSGRDAEKVAADLEALVPRGEWIGLSLRLVLHGRRVCVARRPRCEVCSRAGACARRGL